MTSNRARRDLEAALDEAEQQLARLRLAVADGRARAAVLTPAEFLVHGLRRRVEALEDEVDQ